MGTRLDPVNELNHYYKDTILSVFKNGVIVPFYANEFYKGNAITYIECSGSVPIKDSNGNSLWAPQTFPADALNYEYPAIGYLNINKCAYYVQRSPDRQYKKGVIDKSLEFSRKAEVLDYIDMRPEQIVHRFNFIDAWMSLFNPKYFSVDELITKINEVEIYSGAFCSKYALMPSATCDKILILYKNYIVGYLKDRTGILPQSNTHLVESLSEYMQIEVT